MRWTIEFSDQARKRFDKLDRTVQQRILKYLTTRVEPADDPFTLGNMLTGELAGHIRFRIGDYRLIARIEQDRLVILIVGVGHRRLVYD